MKNDGSILLSTGPLPMTVDANTLGAVTPADADGISVVAASSSIGRHLANN